MEISGPYLPTESNPPHSESEEPYYQRLEMADIFHDAIDNGESDTALHIPFSDFVNASKAHFELEEKSIIKRRRPAFSRRKAEHKRLVRGITKVQSKLKSCERKFSKQVINVSSRVGFRIQNAQIVLRFFLVTAKPLRNGDIQ